jgi:proton-translocating NADH-quinone oxidoreductase chain N
MVDYAILIIALPLFAAFLIPLVAMVNKNWPKYIPILVTGFNSILAINLLLYVRKIGKPLVIQIGGFIPPFGINLFIGYLAIILLLLISIVGFLVSIYTINTVKNAESRYYILYILLIMGITGLVVTGDLFNMFVFLEITSISAYSLTAYKRDGLSLEATIKYIIIGSLASVFVLIGIAVIYYSTHTLNIADIANQINTIPTSTKMFALSMLLIGLAIESELFPVNGWVPDVYQVAPTPITALFSSIVVKAMIYVFFRVLFTVFRADMFVMNFVMGLGVITLLIGEISALKQTNIKRMLAYSSIGQVGLIVIAIASYTNIGIAGGIYQMINHAMFKGVLFLATAYMITSMGGTGKISDLKGIAQKMPISSFIVAFSIIALLGVPPLAGFWAKIMILGGVMSTNHKIIAALILFATIVEAVYYLKFIAVIYDRSETVDNFSSTMKLNKIIPVVLFAITIILFSLVPQFLIKFQDILFKAANELTNVSSYISTVLGS